jgi:hypothetical protein
MVINFFIFFSTVQHVRRLIISKIQKAGKQFILKFIKSKKTIMNKRIITILSPIIIAIVCFLIYGCEGNLEFIPPDKPEKLSVIAIVNADDTTKSILFEKTYQPEYSSEETDSIRELSFTISSKDHDLFSYTNLKSLKRRELIKIPGNINFTSGEKFYFNAKEESSTYTSEVEVPSAPKGLHLLSVEQGGIAFEMSSSTLTSNKSAVIDISFESELLTDNYYTIQIEGTDHLSQRICNVLYSVQYCNLPGFAAEIPGIDGRIFLRGIAVAIGHLPYYAFFMSTGLKEDTICNIQIIVGVGDQQIFDYKKPVRIKLLSIPKELYYFEKSLYEYRKGLQDPFSEPVYLNGNIKGGYGIFAVCRSMDISFTLPWEEIFN